MRNALRLALGTLTVLPVRPPTQVDRRTAGRAMVLAPLVGLVLAVVVDAVLWLLERGIDLEHRGSSYVGTVGNLPAARHPPLGVLEATVAVALLALLTRGLHLDGLADTADGLGSGRPAPDALALMRRGDVGPFGVVALVLGLLVQVAALSVCLGAGHGGLALCVTAVVSRLVLPVACSAGIPSARPDGLGHLVAGTVSRSALAVAVLLTVVCLALAVVVSRGTLPEAALDTAPGPLALVLGLLVPVAVAGGLCWRCVRRLGGITGDVLGACVEVAATLCLLVLAVAVAVASGRRPGRTAAGSP